MNVHMAKAAAQTLQPVGFFSLECTYTIAPGATLPGLLRDGHALVSSARGVLEELDIGQDALFAVLHLLRQADAALGAADDLAERQADCAAPSGEAAAAGASITAATLQQAQCVHPAAPYPGAAELKRLASQADHVQALLVVLSENGPGGGVQHPEAVRTFNALHDLAEATATRLRDDLNAAALHAASVAQGAEGGAA
ncbi:MAG: hypothetical protein V4795_00430 [Pseudomonadota bacterium]